MLAGPLHCPCGHRLGEYADGAFTLLGPGRRVLVVALHVAVLVCGECGHVNPGPELLQRLLRRRGPRPRETQCNASGQSGTL
jgi:hypothetical protein